MWRVRKWWNKCRKIGEKEKWKVEQVSDERENNEYLRVKYSEKIMKESRVRMWSEKVDNKVRKWIEKTKRQK